MAGSSSTTSMARSDRASKVVVRRVLVHITGQASCKTAPNAYACGNPSGPRADEKSLRHIGRIYSPRSECDEGGHLRGLPDHTFHFANKVEQETEGE